MAEVELQVKPWSRGGHQRLYVNHSDGTNVGWWDMKAGTEHLVEGLDATTVAAFRVAVAAAIGGAPKATTVRPKAAPSPAVVPAKVVTDLGVRQPGQAARLKANEEAEAARAKAGKVRFDLVKLLDVKTDERAWRIGAIAEERVGARLDTLHSAGWHTLHAVPIGTRGSDIDHVVIGPAGVFTVNTKHHPDGKVWVGGSTILVNGHRQPYVRNSRHEAERATRLLTAAAGAPVPVRAVLAIAAADLVVKEQPDDVRVVGSKAIHRWLASLPVVFQPLDVERLWGWARRSSTWEGDPDAPVEGCWAPDPYGRAELRWFDGTTWTAHVSTAGTTAVEAV